MDYYEECEECNANGFNLLNECGEYVDLKKFNIGENFHCGNVECIGCIITKLVCEKCGGDKYIDIDEYEFLERYKPDPDIKHEK